MKIKPIITEKTLKDAKAKRFSFKVPAFATKSEIKNALNELFGVTVKSVSTMKYKGVGSRSDFKKALVTLGKDQTIEVFNDKKDK